MTRALTAAVALAVLALAGVLVVRGDADRSYEVAAIFDTAKGIVPGQQVKVAGAVVGRVDAVHLTASQKARITMQIGGRYGPFYSNATCTILPEGLISENYVECDPGDQRRGPLEPVAGNIPTVPVEQTEIPVSLQDLISVFSLPTSQRLRVFINEIGLATAGRGDDLNNILRRAAPALTQGRRVLATIARQRRQLASAVGQTDRVLTELARHDEDVRTFVQSSAAVTRTTAAHSSALERAVERLPGMLDAVRPGLRSLDSVATAGTPLLDDVQASTRDFVSLTHRLPAFTREATPAFRTLESAAGTGRPAVTHARPLLRNLEATATEAGPFASNLNELLVSTRDQGGFEGIIKTVYALATAFGGYDEISHIGGAYVAAYPRCFLGPNLPGCSHSFKAPGAGTIPVNDPSFGSTAAPMRHNAQDGPSESSPRRNQGTARRDSTERNRTRRPERPSSAQTGSESANPLHDLSDSVNGLLDYLLK